MFILIKNLLKTLKIDKFDLEPFALLCKEHDYTCLDSVEKILKSIELFIVESPSYLLTYQVMDANSLFSHRIYFESSLITSEATKIHNLVKIGRKPDSLFNQFMFHTRVKSESGVRYESLEELLQVESEQNPELKKLSLLFKKE